MRASGGGGAFFDETHTADNSAPTGSDGGACKMAQIGGDWANADEWTVVCTFAENSTLADVTPYEKIGGAWCPGATYRVKADPDSDGGVLLDLPAHGVTTHLDFLIENLDGASKSITIKAYHNEHSEAL